MLFNSLHFLIFFPIVVAIYFSIPHRFRWILLLLSSYYFYMSWKAEYIILIMISTLIDYISAIQMDKSEKDITRRFFLILSVCTNIGLLFAFKYFNFFSNSVREILAHYSIQLSPITLKVLLPVGISFYTFQTLSYTIDVYRRKIKPERHLGIFAVYVSFFPQLVAGPIERAKNLLPQFLQKQEFNYQRVTDGLKLMLWGFFKKVVIADRLALVVNTVFNDVYLFDSGTAFLIAVFFFAFQIYCDFSGYSDIAIGAAQVMGIKLMDNFNRPYHSRSIREFWKRWHISLSTWFKDYLYIPLGGNRVRVSRMYINLMIVFVVSGLWHGAQWTFVIWGALHGSYLILEMMTKNLKEGASKALGLVRHPYILRAIEMLLTFILVNFAWIFFRANSLEDALYVIRNLFSNLTFDIPSLQLGIGYFGLFYALGIIAFMEFVHIIQEHRSIRQFLRGRPFILRWMVYITCILLIALFGVFSQPDFIYFQF